jgi:hypothetical protein
MIFKLFIFSLCLKAALSFYNGAPSAACVTLIPTHGDVFPVPIPVAMDLQTTNVRAGYPMSISIRSLPDTIFGDFFYRGFIIQARTTAGETVGTWDITTGARHVVCPQFQAGSTITHTGNADRQLQTFIWRAPAYNEFAGDFIMVNFHFSIVMNVGMFWPGLSAAVRVENPNVARNQTQFVN